MNRSLLLLSLVASLAMAGCPGDPGPVGGADAGDRLDAPRLDAPGADGAAADGAAPADGGEDDAGERADTGGTTSDAGEESDGGGVTDDAGTTDTDAGATDTDAGSPGTDAGTTDTDAGTPDTDAGAPGTDAGASGCASSADCPIRGTYCFTGNANCDGTGTCSLMPTSCPDILDPVCGCDGLTYLSACEAQRNGVNIASGGECAGACRLTPTRGCCFDDGDCGRGSVCVGERCRTGGEGVCHTPAPTGQCWEDAECPRGVSCVGVRVCPCGALCILPDMPGTCGGIAG